MQRLDDDAPANVLMRDTLSDRHQSAVDAVLGTSLRVCRCHVVTTSKRPRLGVPR